MSDVRPVDGTVWPHLTAAFASMVCATLPVFMLGALAVQIRDDLNVELGSFGYLTALYYVSGTVMFVIAGWLAEVLGSVSAMRIALVADGVILLAIGLYASSFVALALLMVVAGVTNALAQPAANLHLVGNVPATKMGTAFGVKQSSVPAATLVAGAAVPTLAVTVGWRWAFIAAGIMAVMSLAAVRGANVRLPRVKGRRPDSGIRLLLALGAGAGLASGAAVTIGVYLVAGAADHGIDVSVAGILLVVASIGSVVTRVVSGRYADTHPERSLGLAAMMMCAGAVGIALLALSGPWTFVIGALMGFSFGWGWPAIFVLSIVQSNPSAPAMAAAVTQMGAASGSIFGPILFGVIVTSFSFTPAWLAAAVSMFAGAALVGWLHLRISRTRRVQIAAC